MTTIKCNECKCLIKKEDAQEVSIKIYHSEGFEINLEYYCQRCKKTYDKAFYGIYEHLFYKKVEIEVDKEGNSLEVKRLQDELKACRKGNDDMYKYNIFYLVSISILIATIIYTLSN